MAETKCEVWQCNELSIYVECLLECVYTVALAHRTSKLADVRRVVATLSAHEFDFAPLEQGARLREEQGDALHGWWECGETTSS